MSTDPQLAAASHRRVAELRAIGSAAVPTAWRRRGVWPTRRGWRLASRWGGWATLGGSLLVYTILAVASHQPFHEGARALAYFDLRIYRGAAQRVIHGDSLYTTPILRGLGFTYPPFAAILLTPLAYAPLWIDQLTVTMVNVILLVWLLRRTLLISFDRFSSSPGLSCGQAQAWSLAALAAAAALWLEPVSVTLGYGQIDLLIAALVVLDLSQPDTVPTKGAAIGLATAIKLTPLIFIAYLLLSGRRRAAVIAGAVFAGSIALAFATTTGDASRYWAGLFLHSSRIGGVGDPANQSLRGLVARLGANPSSGWPVVAIATVALLGLALGVRAARHGDEAAGFSLTALSGLLASPISWTHHWTLAVPALLLLARRAHDRRSWPLATAVSTLAYLGYAYLPERADDHPRPPGIHTLLTSDPYALAAMIVLGATAVMMTSRAKHERARQPRRGRPAHATEAPGNP